MRALPIIMAKPSYLVNDAREERNVKKPDNNPVVAPVEIESPEKYPLLIRIFGVGAMLMTIAPNRFQSMSIDPSNASRA